MTTINREMTIEEFEAFVNLPENDARFFELINGEIVEMPSNVKSSVLSGLFITYINNFILPRDLGYTSTEQGGYVILGQVYAPDVAFVSKVKQLEPPERGFNPITPDLVVEVVSPTDDPADLMDKVTTCLNAGAVVWVAYSNEKLVRVYTPGKPPQIVHIGEMLDGGDVLPGFTLDLRLIFKSAAGEGSA